MHFNDRQASLALTLSILHFWSIVLIPWQFLFIGTYPKSLIKIFTTRMAYTPHSAGFKSGDRTSVTNYRPISLLCIISKVLEKIVYQHLFDFIYNQLSAHQFGFIPGRFCLQQLLLFTNELHLAKSTHCDADVIYLDYKIAFDSMVHNKLLQVYKPWACGIDGDLWSLLNYITENHVYLFVVRLLHFSLWYLEFPRVAFWVYCSI